MIGGTVRHDLAGLETRMRLYPAELMAASLRAKNRTAASTRVRAGILFAPLYRGLKIGAIRKQIRIGRATRAEGRAFLEFTPKRFRLFGNFNARQSKRGVRVTGGPWRIEDMSGNTLPLAVLQHAFLARTSAGSAHVWVRVGRARYPITAIMAPGIAAAYREKGVGAELIAFARRRYREVLAQEFKYRVGKKLGG